MAFEETIFINGIYSNEVPANAPDWILGRGAIHPGKLMQWLVENQDKAGETGYINYVIKRNKKDGKRFISVDTWKKPQTQTKERTYQPEDFPISTERDQFYDPTVPPLDQPF
jgi:hypothetical protein